MTETSRQRPVVVFGISGATWEVIDPLIAQGQLPNLALLRAEGTSGVLRSVRADGDKHFRPQVAWPTLATGVFPDRHGVTRFFSDARDLKQPALWDALAEAGVAVGLFGWPGTWPPEPLNGFIVPSHLARDAQTWPRELGFIKSLDRLQQGAERGGHTSRVIARRFHVVRKLIAFGLGPQALLRLATASSRLLMKSNTEERSLLLRHAKLDLSIELFLRLVSRHHTGFSAFVTFLVDLVSHRYWRYREPDLFAEPPDSSGKQFRSAVDDAYRHVDRAIGRILSQTSPNAVFAVVSEHGMSAEVESAEVGPWRYVIKGSRVRDVIGFGSEIEVCPVARWVAFRCGPDQSVQLEISARLKRIVVAQTGKPLLQIDTHADDEVIAKLNLHREDPVYARGDLDSLTISYDERSMPFSELAMRLGRQRSAMHDENAMLVIRGPGIARGHVVRDATLVDVMPTLLRAAERPIPAGLDGTVLDIFDAG